MGTVMNMSSYKIQRGVTETEYGEEVKCAGWIPALALMVQLQPFVSTNKLKSAATDLATVIV